MDTDNLIKALAADTGRPSMPLRAAWGWAALAAAVLAGIAFFSLLGPRHDIGNAVQTARFLFKFVVTLALAATAYKVATTLTSPGARAASLLRWLLVAPLMLAAGVVLELLALPPTLWETRLTGTNSMLCLTFIPLIGAGPLVVFLAMLRYGAPTHPAMAGAVAGLLAGGVAATFYAAHCPDDSPLFVASWYTIAIAGLTAAGAILAPRVARW